MKVTNLNEIKRMKVEIEGVKNVYRQVPLSKDDGAPNFSFRVFTIGPNGHTPYHQHPFEHLNYVIEGQGSLVTESGDKIPIKKGDFGLTLPNEMHQYRNELPDQPLVIICAVPKEFE